MVSGEAVARPYRCCEASDCEWSGGRSDDEQSPRLHSTRRSAGGAVSLFESLRPPLSCDKLEGQVLEFCSDDQEEGDCQTD